MINVIDDFLGKEENRYSLIISSVTISTKPRFLHPFNNQTELYIPANILPYGIYQVTLMASMTAYPSATDSCCTYVQVSPSGITANLVPLGTSVVISDHNQNLKLDPGNFTMDIHSMPVYVLLI